MEDAESSKLLTFMIDFIATVVFIGLISVRMRMRVFAGDYAVKLVNIRKGYKGDIKKDIEKWFDSKYGKVHEVSIVKDTGDILKKQMILSQISRKVGDLKMRNEIIGAQTSKKLLKCLKKEEFWKKKLEDWVIKNFGTEIKEIYVIFEMPIHKKKLIENTIEIGGFISSAKDPQKKKFLYGFFFNCL